MCAFKNEQLLDLIKDNYRAVNYVMFLVQKVLKSVTLELKGKYSALRTLGKGNQYIYLLTIKPSSWI